MITEFTRAVSNQYMRQASINVINIGVENVLSLEGANEIALVYRNLYTVDAYARIVSV